MNRLFAFNPNQNNFDDPAQWPAVPGGPLSFAILRFWDTGVTWKDIETSAGVYNFTRLDQQINLGISHGTSEFIYALGKTPAFYGGGADGATPPTDNTKAAAFASAFINHVRATFPGITIDWEHWNEPNLLQFWNGTAAQLLALNRAVYAVLHPLGIKILSPSGSGSVAIGNFILSYLTACAGNFPFDVFAYHAYLHDGQRTPNSGLAQIINDIKVKKNTFGISAMPIWFTEGSWGTDSEYPNGTNPPGLTDTEQATYLTSMYSIDKASGIEVFCWYSWNNSHGFGVLAIGSPPVANAAGLAFASLLGVPVSKTATFSLPVAAVFPAPIKVQPVQITVVPAGFTPTPLKLTINDKRASGTFAFNPDTLTLDITDGPSGGPSPSGAMLAVGEAKPPLVDVELTAWSFGTASDARGTVVRRNGVDGPSAGVLLLFWNGIMYLKTKTGAWWGGLSFSMKQKGDPRINA
jgi:Glycosyl hydrolase catalytic core